MSNLDFCSNTSVGTSNKHMVQGDEQPPYTDSKRAAGDRLYNRPKKKKKKKKTGQAIEMANVQVWSRSMGSTRFNMFQLCL